MVKAKTTAQTKNNDVTPVVANKSIVKVSQKDIGIQCNVVVENKECVTNNENVSKNKFRPDDNFLSFLTEVIKSIVISANGKEDTNIKLSYQEIITTEVGNKK